MNVKKKFLCLLALSVCTMPTLWANGIDSSTPANAPVQQNSNGTITGKVTDKNGESLIGVSVKVKGTPVGTITDVKGSFSLNNVSPSSVLVFSYIGMNNQEIKVGTQTLLNVKLEDNSVNMGEVVVVGYGTMRKKDLTGSVVQINPNKIADQNPGTVQDILRGTPGLQIGYDASAKGSGASIVLRGENSLGTKPSPLIILDGMAFYGELSEINPDDIGQIDVLKDASSTAIYGAKAAAGVIIITTKKGKVGKPVINVSANLAVNSKSAFRDYFNASDYMRYREDWYMMNYTYGKGADGLYGYYQAVDSKTGLLAYPAGYFNNPNSVADQAAWASTIGKSGIGPTAGESNLSLYARRLEMNNSKLVFDNFLAGNTYDWNDATFRTGLNQDYNASISGATDRINYYMSFGYLNNEGAVQGNSYRAYRSNLKLNAKVTNWLELGANVNFQDRTDGDIQVSLGSNYWDANMLRNSPYASMYTADGGYEQYPMGGKTTKGGYNYYFDRQYYNLEKGYTVLNTIFNAKITLPLGFSYQFNITPRYQWFNDRYFMSAALPDASASSRGVNRGNGKNFDLNLNNTLIWDKTFKDIHHFTVTLVQEAEEHRTWSDNINARNIAPTDVLGLHYTDGGNKLQSSFSTYDSHYTGTSYLGRAFYSYDDRYMFTGTFRRDGFSGFGANNPWGNFGSVGLGWTFTNEKFLESTKKWLDMGKIRVSWGTNGNRDFKPIDKDQPSADNIYRVLANLKLGSPMVYYNNGTSTVVNSLTMDRLAAPSLEWEKTKAYNVGLDFSVFNHVLSGSVEYYFKKTKDLIMPQRLPSFTGFNLITANLGEVQNQGFEISLTSNNIQMKDFTWSTSAGFSLNKSRINHIYYSYDANGKEQDDIQNKWYIGKPVGEIWDYETDGIWQNNPTDIASAALVGQRPGDIKVRNNYTEDDKILTDGTRVPVYNDKDKAYLGTTAPPVYWNLRNEFTLWKDLSISFSLYSYMGHKSIEGYWLNQDNGGSVVTNAYNVPAKEYWTPDNPTNEYARLNAVGPNTGLSGGVSKLYNRSFVRFDDISIGYTLPQKWTRKYQVEKIRINASCHNIGTISGWKYGDPEAYNKDSNPGRLATRTFNFGLNITL
jgi:TonB-linked SusC/RagA family outer membrane protein